MVTTQDTPLKETFINLKVRTNIGKQSLSFVAIDIWKDLPSSLKDASVFAFPKQIKYYLLSKQQMNSSHFKSMYH